MRVPAVSREPTEKDKPVTLTEEEWGWIVQALWRYSQIALRGGHDEWSAKVEGYSDAIADQVFGYHEEGWRVHPDPAVAMQVQEWLDVQGQ